MSVVKPSCSFPSCGRPVVAKELCAKHYRQHLRGGELTAGNAPPGEGGKVSTRITKATIDIIDRLAKAEDVDRAEWLRRAIAERIERQLQLRR